MNFAKHVLMSSLLDEFDKELATKEHFQKSDRETCKKEGIGTSYNDEMIERIMLIRGHIADLIDDLDELRVIV